MDILGWIATNKQWLFSGGGVVLIAALIKVINIKTPRKYGVDNNPYIERNIELDISKVKLYLVTFIPSTAKDANYTGWQIDAYHDIEIDGERLLISKRDIRDKLKNKNYPFKFALEVDNKHEIIREHYAKLLDAGLIVTGAGTASHKGRNKWHIWFLFDGEPCHKDIGSTVSINHKLI